MVNIELSNNRGFEWNEKNNIFVKGFVYLEDHLLSNNDLSKILGSIDDINDLKNKILEFNGFFSIIIQTNNNTYLISDRLKSFPIFYSEDNNGIIITDTISKNLRSKNDIDKLAKLEFIHSNYAYNNRTLLSGVKQVTSGQIVAIHNKTNELSLHTYFKHFYHKKNDKLEMGKNFEDKLRLISYKVIKRLIHTVNNRTILLSLSGGYDSRYIAVLLKEMNYKNVICFTYGSKNSHEVKISEKVANQLNFKWIFIEYTDSIDELFDSNEIDKYLRYTSNYSVLPHYQDFFALKELTKMSYIPKDAVIVTGFSGDVLGGSKLLGYSNRNYQLGEFLESVLLNEFKFFNRNQIKENKATIILDLLFDVLQDTKGIDFDIIHEEWLVKNRISKFVINPNRNYEYFGFEWRMPLWDNALMEFWYEVPNKYRYNSIEYNNFLESLFKEYNVNYGKFESNVSKLKIIPKPIYNLLKSIYYVIFKNKIDVNNYTFLIDKFKKDIKHNHFFKKPLNMNINLYLTYIFAVWFVDKFEDNEI